MNNKRMKPISIHSFTALAVLSALVSARGAVGTLSGPFTHKDLQVFLVHGNTQLEERPYATLSEAMAKGIVVVKETGSVQELTIENMSRKTTVFLNAGDIVKGGRQDRTVRDDLILPPQSGPVPLATFCVEHGRWTKRGEENPAAFSGNSKVLSSRKLKMASRYESNQGEVWSGVAEQQTKLNENLSRYAGKPVDTRSGDSASSLQLTLESQDLDAVKKGYLERLSSILNGKTDVIGFVFAINGELNSAEVYNNKNLFRALWPKLLDGTITEAITEDKPGRAAQSVSAEQVRAFFEQAVLGSVQQRPVWKTTLLRTYVTPTTLLFETVDREMDETWLHKSFINRGNPTVVVPLDRESRPYQQRLER